MASLPRRVYWDACAFLGLINQEPEKTDPCSEVWGEAERGETLIYTSFFTYAEVFKAKCEGKKRPLSPDDDAKTQQTLTQHWVKPVVVDGRIGMAARKLMREYAECKKPSDAIHLATALALSVDEMHTYDGNDLLNLDGKVLKADGQPLRICTPNVKPQPIPQPTHPDLFKREGG